MEDQILDPGRHHDVTAGSSLLSRRSKRLQDSARPVTQKREERPRHDWVSIPLGRVCSVCQLAQVTDEFDDAPVCKAR